LVPIVADRLRIALDLNDVTPNKLAQEMATQHGNANQTLQRTLSYILTGRNRQCRRSLVQRLARRLGVNPEFLTGEGGVFVSSRLRAALWWFECREYLRNEEVDEQTYHRAARHLRLAVKALQKREDA
jgi:hypothetical protein